MEVSNTLTRHAHITDMISWSQKDIGILENTLKGGKELLDKYGVTEIQVETVLSGHRDIINRCLNEIEKGNEFVEIVFFKTGDGQLDKRELHFSKHKPDSPIITEASDKEFELWLEAK